MIRTAWDFTPVERQLHAEKYGGSNELPPHFREITEEEFARSMFFIYEPQMWEYRQVGVFTPEYRQLRLLHFHDGSGIAIWNNHQKGTVHYAKFAACEHELHSLSAEECREFGINDRPANCYAVYRCAKCGYSTSVDSSG